MKKQFLLAAAVMLSITLTAQEAQPVVIVSTTGKVSLIPEGKSKACAVKAGAVAKNKSKLKLSSNATAIVYCDKQFKEVKGGQTIALSSICTGSTGTRILDSDYDFGEKLMAAVDMVSVAKSKDIGWSKSLTNPKKNGDGWGTSVTEPKAGSGWGNSVTEPKAGSGWGNSVTEPKAGSGWGNSVTEPKAGSGWGNSVTEPKAGSGWGGKGTSIHLIMPFGKVDAAKTIFSWSRPANTEPYKLEIVDETGKLVYTVTVKDTTVSVDLASLKLAPDHAYYWKVSVGGSKALVSNELAFGIGDLTEKTDILKRTSESSLYAKTKSKAISGLIQATALENDEWFYDAIQVYAGLNQKGSDPMVRMMHAAFWMRYGFRQLSEKAAKGL